MRARSSRALRVNFLGNTCNNHYSIAKALRRIGVDAHLFYNAGLHWQTHPAADDPDVASEPPEWLHPYSGADEGPHPFRGPTPELAALIADCDLIHAEDVGLVWAAQSGRPYVWDPYGFDMKSYGFHRYWRTQWNPAHSERMLAALAWRQAQAGVDAAVLGLWYEPMAEGIALLESLAPGRFLHHIALATDTDAFSPGDGPTMQELLAGIGSLVKVRGLTVFHPVRIMFTEQSHVNKANDRLIRAVGALHAAGHEITLVLSDRGTPCEPAARALIAELGLTERVAWMSSVPRHQLVQWYRAADVTADEFEGGALGSVAFESLSCGTPLLTRLLHTHESPTYWSPQLAMPELPPIMQARTVEEIAEVLRQASTDGAWLHDLGQRSRQWMLDHGNPSPIASAWLRLYERILASDAPPRDAGWRKPLPQQDVPTPQRDLVVAQLLDVVAPVDFECLMLALDECPDDPRLIAGLVSALRSAGHGAVASAVLEDAARLLPHAFGAKSPPLQASAPSLVLDDDALLIQMKKSLAEGRVCHALQSVDTLQKRHPDSAQFHTLRRTIVAAVTPAILRRQQGVSDAPAAVSEAVRGREGSSVTTPAATRRPRILAIADVRHWIFERHAQTLRDALIDEFEIVVHYFTDPYDESAYDLIYPMEFGLVPAERISAPWKYVTALRSHLSWKTATPRALARFLSTHFQRTHVVSARLRDELLPFLPDVAYVTHGVDGLRFTPVNRHRSEGMTLRVGWAGNRAAPVKGFAEFVAPLQQLPGVEVVFCGYSDRNLTLDEMPAFYAGIDVYVCTSATEGNNNSLLEAAATGTAIITTDTGTVTEYLAHEQSALIVPRTADAFRLAVERLRDDAALRVRMGRAAASAVHPAWTWAVRAEKHRLFFREALGNVDAARLRMTADTAPAEPRDLAAQVEAVQQALAAGRILQALEGLERLVLADAGNPVWASLVAEVRSASQMA